MSNTRNDIAKRLGSAQPNARPGNRLDNAYPGPRRATSEAARSIAADLEATYGIQAWVEDAIVFVDAKNFERAKQARTEQNKKHYNSRIALRAVSSRPGAKAKMAEPLPTRPIGSGKNRYLIYHQAVAEEIEQIKQMRNGIIYLREQLSNAKSDMNGSIASFMKVKEFEDEAKAKAQFQNAENEFKQAKEKVQYYLKQVRFSRPGAKAKFASSYNQVSNYIELQRWLEYLNAALGRGGMIKTNNAEKAVDAALKNPNYQPKPNAVSSHELAETIKKKIKTNQSTDYSRPGAKVK